MVVYPKKWPVFHQFIRHQLAVLIPSIYADNKGVKDKMDADDSEVCEFVVKSFTSDGDTIDAMRNNLMTQLFPENVAKVGGKLYVDCEENITALYGKFCGLSPVLCSMTCLIECCGNTLVANHFIRFDLHDFKVEQIQASIHALERNERCHKCDKHTEVKYIPQTFLTFDTEGDVVNVSLKDLQRNIEVDQQQYELVGLVESKANQKHFVPHILRGNQWITYDDLKTKTCEGKIADKVVLIMYRKACTMTKIESISSSTTTIRNSPNKTDEIDTTNTAPETPKQEKMVLRSKKK